MYVYLIISTREKLFQIGNHNCDTNGNGVVLCLREKNQTFETLRFFLIFAQHLFDTRTLYFLVYGFDHPIVWHDIEKVRTH